MGRRILSRRFGSKARVSGVDAVDRRMLPRRLASKAVVRASGG